jgi:CRP-like cAMP-binding protein/CheY-like chemotaxis protein
MKNILLIEDNNEMRENIAEILELAGFKVLTAQNGKVGVDLANKHKPDLIICDIMMPELDGYGVLHILGKNPDTMTIPFIFLTAKAEKTDFRKGMNLGADDYITKPFNDVELLDAVEMRLKKNEFLKKEYSPDESGLNEFLDNVKGLEELNKLSTDRKFKTYKKKDTIYMEGGMANGIYFISKGKVKTHKSNSEGKEYIVDLYKEGDFFGYSAIFDDTPYSESATVLEDAEVCMIPKHDFLSLLYNNREVSGKFIKMMANNIKDKEEKLLNLAYNSVRRRVADALVLLYDRYHKDSKDPFIINITREDLSNLVGTATESLIRTLSDFREEGLIDLKGSNITVISPEKISKMRN